MVNFNNKVVWIIRASSGIGEALVYAFAKQGSKLVLSARREEELQRVKKATKLPVQQVLILPMDMTKSEEFPEKVATAIDYFGQIDIFIHNAGISQRSLVKDTPLLVDRMLMEVNFFGVVALTKAILPHMLARKAGHFVVISSIAGKLGTPMRSTYAASKHALHGFFDSLRAELWQENIKVTIICPGYIKTAISINALNETGKKYNKMDENQEKGLSVEVCAKEILNAVKKEKLEVYIGRFEVLSVYLKRFFPGILSRVLRNLHIKTTEV